MLNLHVVQALHGDCLLLEYGEAGHQHFLLIDGGPTTVYEDHLRPVLAEVAARGGQLDRVVLTHADDDHVIGLVSFFAELSLAQSAEQPPLIGVNEVWMNSFAFDAAAAPSMAYISIPPAPAALSAPADEGDAIPSAPQSGVAEGMDLRELLTTLQLPVNQGFPDSLVTLDAASQLALNGLTLTLVGPTQSNLDRLSREWLAWLAKHRAPEGVQALTDYDRELKPDQSIPNRSSIMFVAEYGGKRLLFTGDGRANDLMRGLERQKLLAKGGTYHVDVLKVPHHGSERNNSRKLFRRVTADVYVFSASGKDGNPDMRTLAWLALTLKEQGRKALVVATNKTANITQMLEEFPPADYGYELEVLPHDRHAFTLPL